MTGQWCGKFSIQLPAGIGQWKESYLKEASFGPYLLESLF
jgi:hypothetical protein